MTPLLGTKHPSAPVGAKSGGERRTARLLLSCALWSGMCGYGAAWAAAVPRAGNTVFPVHRPSGISSGANQAPQPWFSRITASLPTISHHFPRFPGLSRPFPAFPGLSRPFPAPPTPLRRSSVHAPSAFLGQPPGTAAPARSLLSCALWRGMGRLWRGMGGMGRPEPLSAQRPHQQQGLSGFHETRDTSHESRLLRPFGSPWVREGWRHKKPSSGPLPPPASHCFPVHHCSPINIVLRQCPRAARSLLSCALWRGMGRLWRGMGGGRPPHRQHGLSCSPAVRYFFWSEPGSPTMVFTKHETRDTNHGFFLPCCGRRVVRHAG